MKKTKKLVTVFAAVALMGSAGLANVANAATADNIDGGGATFPLNLMESCRSTFPTDAANTQAATVQYSGVGSGTGRANFFSNLYKFAMTDSLPKTTDKSYRTDFVLLPLIGGAISIAYNLPGVQPAGTVLRLKSDTLAKIFAGTITNWGDPLIKADNTISNTPSIKSVSKNGVKVSVAKSGTNFKFTMSATAAALKKYIGQKISVVRTVVNGTKTTETTPYSKAVSAKATATLGYATGTTFAVKIGKTALGTIGTDNTVVGATFIPATAITVFHRKDTSGTTNNFINYMNKTSPLIWTLPAQDAFEIPSKDLSSKLGSYVSGQGNDGVANGVMGKEGAIGYAEVSFVKERQALGKSILSALIQNPAGEFLAGSTDGASKFIAAAAVNQTTGVVTFDYATTVAGAYPITAVSYGMANRAAFKDATAAQNLTAKRYAQFVLNTCAPAVAEIKGYSPLPANIVAISNTLLELIGA